MHPDIFGEPKGICDFGSKFRDSLGKRSVAAFYFLLLTVSNVVPILAYLVLYHSHDCFICFGKDPDRTYSSFQLNLRERNYRNTSMRIGKKATRELNRLSVDIGSTHSNDVTESFA